MSFNELIFSDSPAVLFGRLVALCAMIFLAGRAGVDIARAYAMRGKTGSVVLLNPNYVSVAFGPTLVLFITWALKLADLYSFGAVLISLSGVVALATLLSREFRGFVRRPWREIDGLTVAYLAGAFAFWLMLGVDEHPNLRDSALYLLQGFNIFSSRYAAELPHYGVTFIAPILYVSHTVSATFALFSYGNHFLYYAFGIYWLNLLIAPVIPIGAYLLFRRFAPPWLAVAIAGLFCWTCLSHKIWSLRAESLAWIIGFAFLMVLVDVVSALKENGASRVALRLSPLLAPLFFAMVLTHAVTSSFVAMFSAGYVAAVVAQRWQRSQLFLVARVAALSLLPLLLLFAAFAYTYSGTLLPLERAAAQRPPPGDVDAAMQFDNAWAGAPLDDGAPRVRASPPYTSRKRIAEITAFLPVAEIFRPGITHIPLRYFPGRASESLDALPAPEKWAYVALLACCVFLYLTPLTHSRYGALFWASTSVYVSIILFSVYLDSQSVSLYPLASIRRSFVYVTFSYWLALGVAALDFIIRPYTVFYASASGHGRAVAILDFIVRRYIVPYSSAVLDFIVRPYIVFYSSAFAYWRAVGRAAVRFIARPYMLFYSLAATKTSYLLEGLCRLGAAIRRELWTVRLRQHDLAVAAFVPLWFVLSIGSLERKIPAGTYSIPYAGRPIEAGFVDRPVNPSGIEVVRARLKPLFDAMQFIQAHSSPHDWVFSNVSSSDNAFWFLSSGRYSLTEGASIYQLYFMQKAGAARMHDFANFAITADEELLARYGSHYVLLYKGNDCVPTVCYGDNVLPTNFLAFDENPSFHRVFENEFYRIFERGEAAQPRTDATGATGAAGEPGRSGR